MSRLLRATVIVVFLPAAVMPAVFALLIYPWDHAGWLKTSHWPYAVIAFAAAEAFKAWITFRFIRRLLSPMEKKLRKLKRSSERLYSIVSGSSLGILSFDRNGRLLYMNPSGQALFGIDPAETGRGNLFERLTEDSREQLKRAMQVSLSHGSAELEVRLLPEPGRSSARTASLHLASREPKLGKPEAYYSALASDITEKKRIEQQLAEAEERKKQITRARGDFLMRVSHEIRTPLHAIVNVASALDRSAFPEYQKESLQRIELLSRHLLRTVNEFLDFSRLEADQIELEREPFKLSNSLFNVMNTLEVLAKDKQIELNLHRDPAIPDWLIGDSYRLEQVLINLVGNAVKFTEAGEIRLSAELDDGAQPPADGGRGELKVRFIVSDTGIGMSEAQLSRLFYPFRQADAATSRQFGGSGLGLVIVRRLVELMGGRLEAESAPGDGTVFRFSADFGLANVQANIQSEAMQTQAIDYGFMGRVLLVDDQEINRSVTRAMLEHFGVTVVTAASAPEAMESLERNEPFDLILMDLHMPEMDGVAAVRLIRRDANYLHIPIVMVTADTAAEQHVLCYEAGVQQILAKPFELKQLRELLSRWLGAASDEDRRQTTTIFTPSPTDHIQLKGLNVRQGLDRLNGDRALYRHLLDKMTEKYGGIAMQVEQLLRDGRRQEAVRVVHSLRGASSLLGAYGVYEAASLCEDALSAMSDSSVLSSPSVTPAMSEMLQALDRELQAMSQSAAKYQQNIQLPSQP